MKCRFLFAFLFFVSFARAEGPAVTVVTGPEPDAFEQIAAKELETTLVALFDAKVTLAKTATDAKNCNCVSTTKNHQGPRRKTTALRRPLRGLRICQGFRT